MYTPNLYIYIYIYTYYSVDDAHIYIQTYMLQTIRVT